MGFCVVAHFEPNPHTATKLPLHASARGWLYPVTPKAPANGLSCGKGASSHADVQKSRSWYSKQQREHLL